MGWSSKTYADGLVQFGDTFGLLPLKELFDAFAKTQPDAAIFSRINADASVSIFFPPASREFGLLMGAVDCEIPEPYGLALLCGAPTLWDEWFGQG